MKWFQNFMRGRYGVDQLSFALLILYFVITILGTAFRIPYIGYVALLLIVWCWFRILSRNTYISAHRKMRNLWGGSTRFRINGEQRNANFRIARHISITTVPTVSSVCVFRRGGVQLRLPARNVKQSLTSVRNSYCRRNILTAVFFIQADSRGKLLVHGRNSHFSAYSHLRD